MRSRLGLRLCVVVLFAALGLQARAESVTGAQRQAASDYLLAVSSTDLQAVAYAIHPAELDRLRFGVLQKLREESARGGNAIRERLFGSAMPLSDVERLTSANLFRAVARRWSPHVRTHDSLEGLSATREGERVHVLVKQRPSKEGGRIETLEVVTLLAYGREWRAALPPEFEALVDDLVSGRQSRAVVAQTPSTIDTPGYGQSDPLPVLPTSLAEYARAFLAGIDALGIRDFGLYGTATGAQLALAITRLAPKRITRLVLDNCGLFTAAQVAKWELQYFPDLTTCADGSHMMRVWEAARRQFISFPWFSDAPEHQLDRPPAPLSIVQSMANHFLIATPSYDVAYRLAFHAENASSFTGLTVPTVLIDWEGSIVRKEAQALIAEGRLPACVTVITAAPSMEARFEAVAAGFA